ncbi:MAG: RNA 2'-phosphotransferase [Promethearchaeota archaeon]
MNKKFIRISKFLSFILRHHPEKARINLDNEGFADLDEILRILNKRYSDLGLGIITKDTLIEMMRSSDKLRFEIVGNKIRALYGHSIKIKIKLNEAENIPDKLYHGTSLKAYKKIQEEGLKKRGRQYVHLSKDIKTAIQVGKRHSKDVVILEIDVKSAKNNGIKFYKAGDVYLSEEIPPKYLNRLEL